MSKEDKQVIDMANSAGVRRERKEDAKIWQRRAKLTRQRRALKLLILALLLVLEALVVLALIVAGHVSAEDVPGAAALLMAVSVAGGLALADAAQA